MGIPHSLKNLIDRWKSMIHNYAGKENDLVNRLIELF